MTGRSLHEEKSGLETILNNEELSKILNSATKHNEIERRFLVLEPPRDLSLYDKEEIEQHYLETGNDSEVRVRTAGGRHCITEKKGLGLSRTEVEVEIPEQLFESIKTMGVASLKKTRYRVPSANGKVVELNVYKDALSGLSVAEAEFESIEEAESFKQPDWFSSEVTYDRRYSNYSLARNGKPAELSLRDGINIVKRRVYRALEVYKEPITVLVAGGSGSGKTFFAKELKAALGDDAVMISLDDYYHSPSYVEDLSKRDPQINLDHPAAVDLSTAKSDLDKLLASEAVTKNIYDFTDGPYKSETIQPHRVIILEGIFALNDKLKDSGTIKLFMDTSKHDRLIRRLLRDVERTTWPSSKILGYSIETAEPMYEKHIEPTKINADVIINSNYDPRLESKRASVVDRQIKFRLNGNQIEYHEKLRKLGAELLFQSNQVDTYYNAHSNDIASRDELVRIRREPGRLTWTYKGPKSDGDLIERRKLDIETYNNVENGLSQIYREVKRIRKTRFVYRLDNRVFSLDFGVSSTDGGHTHELGDFIEFRLPQDDNTATLDKLKTALSITSGPLARSYFEI